MLIKITPYVDYDYWHWRMVSNKTQPKDLIKVKASVDAKLTKGISPSFGAIIIYSQSYPYP